MSKNSNKLQTSSTVQPSKKGEGNIKQSENLDPIWHLYFILMMVATFGGMRLLER